VFCSHYHRFIIRKVPGGAPGETTDRVVVVPIHSSPGADSPVQSASNSGGDILIIGGEGCEGGERRGYEEQLVDGRGQVVDGRGQAIQVRVEVNELGLSM
jgi:hypothetical protein